MARAAYAALAHGGVVVYMPRGKLTPFHEKHLHSEKKHGYQQKGGGKRQYEDYFHWSNCFYSAKVAIYLKFLLPYQIYLVT